jgi:hypothetical protein
MAVETQERQPQMGLTFDQVWAAMMESDRKFQAMSQEADKRQQELVQEMRLSSQETDRKFQEMVQDMKNLKEQMGGLHNSFGELAEHLVAPSIAEKFNALNYHFESIVPGGRKIMGPHGKVLAQIDLLLENGEYAVAVEIKSRPKEDDITKHIARLGVLRQYMDKHNDRRVIRGALAGAVFLDDVKEAAIEAGLYAIVQSGDTMRIEVPEGFTPREW